MTCEVHINRRASEALIRRPVLVVATPRPLAEGVESAGIGGQQVVGELVGEGPVEEQVALACVAGPYEPGSLSHSL